jgi:hypothetical protein
MIKHAHAIWPAWVAWLIVIGLAASGATVWIWARRAALRAWQKYAKLLGGEFRARDQWSPACVTGTVHSRPFLLETATSHEDDAPYYHTRGALPIRNSAGFILGVRRKSLLEEAQTRREKPPFDLDDSDFERQFFVVCNQAEHLAAVLTAEARRELKRYHDVEIYARLSEIEWRRSGEQSDLRILERLTGALSEMAAAIESLPARPATLSQRLADENLIAKGV